ncbi:DUF2399 domain-containing protein [Neobacillus sp. OS1-2]|uniref:DUF2399 domain-containing protein n=1 Tax=Neobacillus sp. OS1-2 TaxID=3070680 RepID=UPI0027E122F4|nr:DUF2399 domain-containing protein [Neobacillus sp. OS1-2]WML38129.1 DUF2399 domain-containing protein [Neobacillus sp. OS1-2]
MIEESFHNYIKDFLLKSGEELEWGQPNYDNFLLEVKIIKRSERTYRILGILTFSIQHDKKGETTNHPKLDDLKFTPRKKVNLNDDDRQTFRWLEEGWILKEVRFEKDEKTVRSSHYRMGFRLYKYEQVKIKQKMDQTRHEFLQLKNDILATLSTQVVHPGEFSYKKELGLQNIAKIMNQLNQNELSSSDFFPHKWHLGSRLRYLHFVHAFSQLCLHKKEFDWKEIGAAYYRKIGGSKEFDSYKSEFIDQLEEWTNVPAIELGLTSLGQITPVFFAGQLSGKYAAYEWGPVHALTNLSIANEMYQTKAKTLWLVENRAILTRMSATEHFLKETNSLIICVDGHLRSAHKNAIVQILDNSDIEQVLIWCDYDWDGLQISKEIHATVFKHNDLTIKFILPEQQVICDWYQFEQYLMNFLENNKMEQEQMMGGVDHWKQWIQD